MPLPFLSIPLLIKDNKDPKAIKAQARISPTVITGADVKKTNAPKKEANNNNKQESK